jgi:hypothetical protein
MSRALAAATFAAALCAAGVMAASGERIQLEDTGLSVRVPAGFRLQVGVKGSHPRLVFHPPPEDALAATFLSLTLEQERHVATPDDYLASYQNRGGTIIPLRHRATGPFDAIEFAGVWKAILNGDARRATTRWFHSIAFAYEGRVYSCSLRALSLTHGEHEQLTASLYELCDSIETSPRP